MRVAPLYDIHGHLPALEAALEDVRRADIDLVVGGGDVVPGPMVRGTLACLLDLDVPVRFIQGNGEVAVLEAMAGRDHPAVPEQHWPVIRWTAQHLQPEYGDFIATWPKTLSLDVEGIGPVLFCHGTPRDDNECFTRLTPEDRLLPIFESKGDISALRRRSPRPWALSSRHKGPDSDAGRPRNPRSRCHSTH